MKNLISIITGCIMLMSCHIVFARQSKWQFDTTIETDRYYELKGKIDGKYAIQIYLEHARVSCDEDPDRFSPYTLKGWYQYDKVGKRIPLIGQRAYGDSGEEYVTLYVPENPVSYQFTENCKISDYKEVFRVANCCDWTGMTWQQKGKSTFPVVLEEVKDYSYETQVNLSFKINGLEMKQIDLTKRSGLSYLDYADVLGKKEIDGEYHVLIGLGHNSRPGSRGFGMCGAGVEGYVAYLKLAKDFEVADFEILQDESCFKDLEDSTVAYDKVYPERGIKLEQY